MNKYNSKDLFRQVRKERRAKMYDEFTTSLWAIYPCLFLFLQVVLGSSIIAMFGYAVYRWLSSPSLNGVY